MEVRGEKAKIIEPVIITITSNRNFIVRGLFIIDMAVNLKLEINYFFTVFLRVCYAVL